MKENFYKTWESLREGGIKKYYLSKIVGMLFIFGGITCGSYLATEKLNLVFLIVAAIIVCLFPLLAWTINEIRYKIYLDRLS